MIELGRCRLVTRSAVCKRPHASDIDVCQATRPAGRYPRSWCPAHRHVVHPRREDGSQVAVRLKAPAGGRTATGGLHRATAAGRSVASQRQQACECAGAYPGSTARANWLPNYSCTHLPATPDPTCPAHHARLLGAPGAAEHVLRQFWAGAVHDAQLARWKLEVIWQKRELLKAAKGGAGGRQAAGRGGRDDSRRIGCCRLRGGRRRRGRRRRCWATWLAGTGFAAATGATATAPSTQRGHGRRDFALPGPWLLRDRPDGGRHPL